MKLRLGLLILINIGDLHASEPVQSGKRRSICKVFLVGFASVAAFSTGLIATAAPSLEKPKNIDTSVEIPDIGCPQIGISKDGVPAYWSEKYPGENCRELISYTNDWQEEIIKRKQGRADLVTRLRGNVDSKRCEPANHECWLKKDTCLSGRPADLKEMGTCNFDLCPRKGHRIENIRNRDGLFLHTHASDRLIWYDPNGRIRKIG